MKEGKILLFHFITVGSFSESSTFRNAHFSNLNKSGSVTSYFHYNLHERLYGMGTTEAANFSATKRLLNAIRTIQVDKIIEGGHA